MQISAHLRWRVAAYNTNLLYNRCDQNNEIDTDLEEVSCADRLSFGLSRQIVLNSIIIYRICKDNQNLIIWKFIHSIMFCGKV